MKEELEEFMDQHSFRELQELIAEICREKANHIRENWQDKYLAHQWDRRANRTLITSRTD